MKKIFEIVLVIASAIFIIAYSTTVFAKDVCFIGDSFTEGLEMYSGIDADFYGYRGISTSGILKKDLINKNLSGKEYKQIYVLLGVNEVCNNDPNTFIENYSEIVRQIQELQPNATLVLQSIFHTTSKKSNTSNFKNEYINKYNYYIWYLSNNLTNTISVDYNDLYDNGNGAMFSDYSKDGVHLKSKYYCKWVEKLNEKIKLLSGRGEVE